ncbi:hypothetical protein MTR_4g037510 [Medicago truncatula]|uniref:Uncharacterized protein n=1 Tax=Medicago truncatula TaxID=3880 RepID=G7JSH5_MEDTR|nr:hypothetical protein MTR_4g037510 [Medicago truncatula]
MDDDSEGSAHSEEFQAYNPTHQSESESSEDEGESSNVYQFMNADQNNAQACWQIFSFSIHGRKQAVEWLIFHLEGENSIYFNDYEHIDDVLLEPSVTESMFTSWLQCNAEYTEARTLTYANFVSKFVYVKEKRTWKPRKRGYRIGRMMWVPPSTGEVYYLRMMLTKVKGPTSYEALKTVNNVLFDSFRDACFAMGFLMDGKEYIVETKKVNV